MLKTLLSHIKEYKTAVCLTPVFAAAEVFVEVLLPFVMAFIIDRGIQAQDMGGVWTYGMLMLACAMLSLIFGVLAGRFAAKASAGFARNLRQAQFEHIQEFSFSNIDRFSTAGLITRMTTDVTNVQNAFQMILRIAVRAPLTLVCSLAMCLLISLKLSTIFLVAIIVLVVAMVLILRKVLPIFRQVFKRYDDLNASTQENVTSIRVVKAFVREDFEKSKFFKASKALYDLSVRAERTTVSMMPMMMLVVYACIIAISWFGAHEAVFGSLSTGNLTALFSYVMSALMSLMMLSMIFVMLTMSLASARRICEVLDERPDITNPENPVTEVPDGSIDFRDVGFSYGKGSGEQTLKGISLHIESGQTIGIIGATGSGKSSLVSLIPRLYDVDEGSVSVGGHDVRRYDLGVIRDSVAVVLQKNVLFSGTVLDNLRWGNEQASLEECRRACRIACADEFIEKMPQGYDTWIEQGGSNVSGGQRQRLCIARALLKNPKVIIFDDSTSAVDTATEAKIRSSLSSDLPNLTKIVIAQRISSVQGADRIIVLDGGRVDAFDTHERLLECNEIYSGVYRTQNEGGGDFDEPEPDDASSAVGQNEGDVPFEDEVM